MNEAVYGDAIKDGIWRCYVIHPDLFVVSVLVKKGKLFRIDGPQLYETEVDSDFIKMYFNQEYRDRMKLFIETYK